MNPTKQDCINWLGQVAQDLLPHVPASAQAGFRQQVTQALAILQQPDPVPVHVPVHEADAAP